MKGLKCLSKIFLPVVTIIALASFVACGEKEDIVPELILRNNSVPAASGDVFLEVRASGNWNLAISYPDDGHKDWLRINPTEGYGSKASIIVHFDENPAPEPRKAGIILKAGKNSAELELTQHGRNGSGGNGGAEQGSHGAKSAPHSWLELPATNPNDGLEYFVHKMKVGSVATRNFSFYWDYGHKVALWVAYPLNPWNIGTKIDRTDAWGYDPLLPESKQAYIGSAYGGGWTRGHQIPSADRLGTYANNAMTFYSTNMTPQDFDFNCGIWAKLEGNVRTLCRKADTLYVVTGCVLGDNPRMIRDRMGKSIAVPEAYFKALLFYSKTSTLAKYNHYSGCGVYMEHSSALTGRPKDYAISIRELEQKTGIDFFANLPATVGNEFAEKIETQAPTWMAW